MALKQLRNNKAPGDDGITAELLEAGAKSILKAVQKLFNSVILEGKTPEAWRGSVVVLFFKKGDNLYLELSPFLAMSISCFRESLRTVSHAGLTTSSLLNKPVSEKALVP